jgi:hypothetical protein
VARRSWIEVGKKGVRPIRKEFGGSGLEKDGVIWLKRGAFWILTVYYYRKGLQIWKWPIKIQGLNIII